MEHRGYANMIWAVIKVSLSRALMQCLALRTAHSTPRPSKPFLALLSGASLVLVNPEVILDTPAFEGYLEKAGRHGCRVASVVPEHAR